MQKALFISFLFMTTQIAAQRPIQKLQLPETRKETTQDVYFGKTVTDPYRWLEDDNSTETKAWVQIQNGATRHYLDQIRGLEDLKKELGQMWNYEKYSNPKKEGNLILFSKNDGLQNQSVVYMQQGLDGTPVELLNPNTMNSQGTSSIGSMSLSKSQMYCAYSISDAGSDWQDIYIMNVGTKEKLKEVIKYSKFSDISWKGDEGFYYSGYDQPKEKDKFSAKTEYQKIFFHKIGTAQSQDQLVYEDKANPLMYKGAALTEDEQWLMLSLSQGTDGSELQFWDLNDKNQKSFNLLSKGFSTNQEFVDNINGLFVVYTNLDAPNYRVVLMDPKTKGIEVLIPEKENKLDAVHRVGQKLFCSYLVNACSQIDVYDLNGKYESTIKLPGLGTVTGFNGGRRDKVAFYTYTSYNVAPTIYKYDLVSGKSELFQIKSTNNNQSKAQSTSDITSLAPSNTVVEQIWFTSKDGTKVPMFVYHRKDIDLKKGPHPVLLYGYGGFNISLTPSFSIPMSYFVQNGGVYVSVSLRGGSEFGEKWHKSGMLSQKQNVFDDFISAAEYLIANKITTPQKLAIHGRSNGGLLVGACMTQRPELFKVALPGVGVLDMLRYHKFTVGWGWAVEYGSSDNKKDFEYLFKYSPLHNVKKDMPYPATMITTADHDDRAVPAHSFKFAATLQENYKGENPMLIRIDTEAGHGAGKPTSKQIEEWGDVLGFTMHHLGMKVYKF